ncbi:MAG: TonB-dependent receptor [Pseudomonadales bacterium]|jgi:TonB-dependent receptor|nr:TonB-dependent receptor [Pseudomonadales bacterium]
MFHRKPIALSVALAALAPNVHARETGLLEEVVVRASPIRAAAAAAIDAKREADNVVDIISSDVIGRFPDQNLADSLGRLPGLAIERDQGQARFINFRGAPFRWTAIGFDGIDVLGAENGRIPRFDSFPSVITSSVVAHKAITPDIPGEAVAGFIDIRTFSPFDIEGPSLSLEGGMGQQDLGDGDIEKWNGRASWSNDRFGVVVFASNNLREQVTDNREYDIRQEGGGILPTELDFRSYFVDREDNAYGGTLEFRPQEGTRLFARTLFSEFIDVEERNQYVFAIEDTDNPGFGLAGLPLTPTQGYQPAAEVTRFLEDGQYRNFTRTNTLGADFPMGDWEVETRLNYTETGNDTTLPIPLSVGGVVGIQYDLRDVEDPIVRVFEPGAATVGEAVPTDINGIDYAVTLGGIFGNELNTEAWKVKGSAARDLEFLTPDARIEFGFQYDTREAEGGAIFNLGSAFPFPADLDPGDFLGGPWDSDFDATLGGRVYDNVAIRARWEQAVGGFTRTFDGDSLIAIEEDIWAAYAMSRHEFSWGDLTWGARLEYTDYTSDGPDINVAFEDDYLNVLPSVHANVNLAEDVKLRLSASSGLSRPTYNELRASAIVDPTARTVTGGNPALDAEEAWGVDASLEWYFAPASLLSVAAFHRRVDNVIYADSITVDGGLYVPTDTGVNYQLIGFANGENGELTGFELNFIGQATELLPEPFDGFGVQGNITLLDSEFETLGGSSFSLPGTSDVIYNASIYYEKFGLSARLNYQYRDEWLSTTENDGLAEFWDEQERVDLSIRYILPLELPSEAQVTVFANANNLTDFVDVRFEGSPATPNQVEGYGRRFLVGVRVDI